MTVPCSSITSLENTVCASIEDKENGLCPITEVEIMSLAQAENLDSKIYEWRYF